MAYGYCIDTVLTAFNSVDIQCNNAESYMDTALLKTYWYQAAMFVDSAVSQLINAIKNCRGGYGCGATTWGTTSALVKIRDLALAAEPEVTMDAILTAMITATEDEYRKFIGLVDAYRVALWNKPFNAEFYAALARGFTG